ncbi:hypothetical protein M2347_000399 [Chryseobacterium sp. H1D6B]|uniref:hypothetical protein n=1 Tax=Chryseobacterium sp. H1D6B TaxID=2940588 RepID=UPI0015CEDCB3|nr:hypothetical protein [Chryseobacterium sp. H1D6B]MDH6250672.1 hypothetical protein [Chryseobacterium sp. H1D6B]
MKKFLFTATMLVSFAALSQAQQRGVGVNTTTPAATLDVVANTTDNTMADAVLVPRMTATQLNAKNAAYIAAQNGALVFVTSGTGTAGTKTANVTGTGFYYYDNPTSLWVAVGGGAAATPQAYQAIRGNVVTVTAAAYTALPTDNVIVTNGSGTITISLPNLTNSAADIGREVKIFNNNITATGLAFDTTNLRGNIVVNQFRGIEFVWTGSLWVSAQK